MTIATWSSCLNAVISCETCLQPRQFSMSCSSFFILSGPLVTYIRLIATNTLAPLFFGKLW